MEQPPIEIFDVKILEPVTTATDLLVSAVCFYAFYKLVKSGRKERVFYYLKMYFLLMGIATTFGGLIGHAFLYKFPATLVLPGWLEQFINDVWFLNSGDEAYLWKLPGWFVSMLSIMFVERASIQHVSPIVSSRVSMSFRVVNLIELAVFMLITFITLNFRYVEIHSGYGLMFVVLSLQLYAFIKTREEGSKYFLFGVATAAIAALFFMNEISLHPYFNYTDISHTIMAIAAALFYIGSRKLKVLEPDDILVGRQPRTISNR